MGLLAIFGYAFISSSELTTGLSRCVFTASTFRKTDSTLQPEDGERDSGGTRDRAGLREIVLSKTIRASSVVMLQQNL